MGIRLILFKEIGFGISLNNPPDQLCVGADPRACLRITMGVVPYRVRRKNQENDFSFFK